jgi:CTP-dependent riboflavin kinase
MHRSVPSRPGIVSSHSDFTGVVESGRGLGASSMADPGILNRVRELAGFPVVPGTLNVRLPGPFNRPPATLYLAAEDIDPGFEAETGQEGRTGFFFAPVMVAGHYHGIAMQGDEPGYPEDYVELICEIHLRQTLGLTDGDQITFSVLDA